jgi:hypothetical protein
MYDKCNYKNGLSKGFFSGSHWHAQRALHTSRRSRRVKVQTYFKKLYILYFITYFLLNYGAPNQIRTDDPILTMDVLYQLSYGSIWWSQTGSNRRPPECKSGALPAELWPRE